MTKRRESKKASAKVQSDPDRLRSRRVSLISGGGAHSNNNNNSSSSSNSHHQGATVSSRFMESFRAVLDEPHEKKVGSTNNPVDALGAQITQVLNASPDFHKPSTSHSTCTTTIGDDDAAEEEEEVYDSSLRPLLSSRNLKWLLRKGNRLIANIRSMEKPHKKIPFAVLKQCKLFFRNNNTKSISGAFLMFFGLTLIGLACSAAAITLASFWSARILWMVAIVSLSTLVDLNELNQALPKVFRNSVANLIPTAVWLDSIVLLGKRYQGREWRRKDFEWRDSKTAPSFQQSLWSLPPPSITEGKRLSVDEQHMTRDEWSHDTTKHVVAIDYCYVILREEFLRRQYSKLNKSVLRKKASDVWSSENNGETITYTRNRNRSSSEPMRSDQEDGAAEGQAGELDPLTIDTIGSGQELERSVSLPEVKSPTDAIEVVRSQSFDDADDVLIGDDVDFSVLNEILEEDDYSDSRASQNTSQDGSETNSDATTDLNWMDIGAEIGMKLLGSAAVQKAMTSHDTAERFVTIREKFDSTLGGSHSKEKSFLGEEEVENSSPSIAKQKITPARPVHSMWTSASAGAPSPLISPTNTADSDASDDDILSKGVRIFNETTQTLASQSQQEALLLTSESKSTRSKSIDLGTLGGKRAPLYAKAAGFEVQDHARDSKDRKAPLEARITQEESNLPLNDISTNPTHLESIEVVREKKKSPISPTPKNIARSRLLPGVKIAIPIFPLQPGCKPTKRSLNSHFQMATVVSSRRLSVFQKNRLPVPGKRGTNCLSVTVNLDKSFLRNGEFAQLTFRILDEWAPRYMPKHSRLPLGSCVATNFGLGILVGWRVEDDCHVVRSLWQRRGAGSASAYLRRDSIHCTMEAAIGFEVGTGLGRGRVLAYVDGGRDFRSGRYFVTIKEEGRHEGQVLELNRSDVLSCRSAQFIPVIEHIREAAQYQLQVDNYTAALQENEGIDPLEPLEGKTWRTLSKYSDILWKSFLRAIEEDDEFDEGVNDFITSIVHFFDRLDDPGGMIDSKGNEATNIVITATDSTHSSKHIAENPESGFWFMNDVFGIFGRKSDAKDDANESIEVECASDKVADDGSFKKTYDRAFAVIRTLMKTVSIARAACVDEPNFKLALSICYEFLLFTKTVIKVQQKNISPHSLQVWRRAWDEIVSTFGPVKERLEKIGEGIAERMEKQGRRAKVRLLRFVDTIVQDDVLLLAMEQGDWDRCGEQVEMAMVQAKIIDEESREHYHKTAQYVYNHFAAVSSRNGNAAARNNKKLVHLAMAVQWIAAPKRFILKLFLEDWVLDTLERILVRVFQSDDVASQMLSIHSSNFHTLRQFRMLKDFTIAGKFWMPLLDAADAEFSWVVSRMPENAKDYMGPLSSLFSLCIVQFHKISEGDLTKDWLDFLLEEEAVSFIHDIDMKSILALESFSRDIKEMMVVLPYYPSIEDDFLNLVDEVDIDAFLREASEAVDDAQKLSEFIREKATIAIERFLDYLPKMSIPVEQRDLADGWVLTCRGADGGDLTLTDLTIKRENLTCQVMGGDTLFFPMLGVEEDVDCKTTMSLAPSSPVSKPIEASNTESSILDHIREMLLQAQRHGCWQVGVGGVSHPPSDRYVATVLHGLPVSTVLNCAIELWRNLEIDDDELLEVAIRDVSYQIELQGQCEEADEDDKECKDDLGSPGSSPSLHPSKYSENSESLRHRFNPRVDPSVLYLEIQKLTFHLDKFLFRIEKHESRRTVFDPVFEGSGSLLVRDVSIKLRVECVKVYVQQEMGTKVAVPVLQIRELDVKLEQVKLQVKDTGADWLLNKVVKGFEDNITQILATNLNEQVREQMELAIQNLNSYFEINPDLLLGLLDITMDDLEEKVVWV